jgi:hypothetical protein
MEMDFINQTERKVKALSKKLVAINVDGSKLHLDLQAWKEKKPPRLQRRKTIQNLVTII